MGVSRDKAAVYPDINRVSQLEKPSGTGCVTAIIELLIFWCWSLHQRLDYTAICLQMLISVSGSASV